MQTYTGIPCFSKVCFIPLCFYKRPTLVPVFTNWKKSEEIFTFMKKGEKWKLVPHFMPFWLTKVFLGMLSFWIAREIVSRFWHPKNNKLTKPIYLIFIDYEEYFDDHKIQNIPYRILQRKINLFWCVGKKQSKVKMLY